MSMTITMEEWLAEIRKIGQSKSGPSGFTSAEISRTTGRGQPRVQQEIRDGIAQGLVKFVGRRQSVSIDGRRCQVPVYQIVKGIERAKVKRRAA